jgi:hypothetical protein
MKAVLCYYCFIETKRTNQKANIMKLQTQAGMFLVIGKTSELSNMKAVCKMMGEEMGEDLAIDNASDDDQAILECGYKVGSHTIKEIKDMFKFYKAKV